MQNTCIYSWHGYIPDMHILGEIHACDSENTWIYKYYMKKFWYEFCYNWAAISITSYQKCRPFID